MKTTPNSHYKIEINDKFLMLAKIEIYIFQQRGFFAKRKYDFKNLPILNYLDKSMFKYILNLENIIDDSYSGPWLNLQVHPDYNIDYDKQNYFDLMTQNIIKNLLKEKQYQLVINNIELCNQELIYSIYSNHYIDKSLIVRKLKTLDSNNPSVSNLLNLFAPTFNKTCS